MTTKEDTAIEMEPIPVKLIQDAAEFTPVTGAWQSFSMVGVAAETTQQVQLLPTDKRRRRAWLQVNTVPTEITTEFEGSAAAPAANGNVLLIGTGALPPPGTYTVNWKVGLDGTVSAADLNNFKLVFGSVLLNGINNPVVGEYPQPPVSITILPGNANTLSVKAIGASTVGSTYSAQITLTPMQVFNGFINVGTLGQVQNGQGGRVYAGQKWEIRAHDMVYFTGDGATPLNVTVLVERDQEP